MEKAHSLSQTTGSGARAQKPRSQTQWPTDKITITGIDANELPIDENALNRFWRVARLIAWERVPITTKFNDLNALFDNVVKEYLEYPGNMSERQTIVVVNAAMKTIMKLHRGFKSKLVNRFLVKGVAPFESSKPLKEEDCDGFMQMKNLERFKKESEEKKQLWARNKHNHRTGANRLHGEKGEITGRE